MQEINPQIIKEYLEIQEELSTEIVLTNSFDKQNVTTVAGVDLAYWEKNNKQYAVCCIVLLDYKTKKVLEIASCHGEVTVPYISGFLAFRELPLVLKTVEKLKLEPDLYMFDGNGYLHIRHMGLATHASFYLKKPTIGVAKTYTKLENTDFIMPNESEGSFTDILIRDEVYGRALRTRKGINPVFVSCGNYIDLATSTELVMYFINHESRVPIPTRLADMETHKERKKLEGRAG